MIDIVLKENAGGSFAKPETGLVKAVCVAIADLGERTTSYMDIDSIKHMIALGFEIPTFTDKETGEEVSGYILWKQFTKSFNSKATLRKDLESWRSVPFTQEELEGFKLSGVMGKPAQINIGLTTGGNPKILNILPKGETSFEPANKPFMYSYEDPKQENIDKLPKYMVVEKDEVASVTSTQTGNESIAETVSALPF